MTSQTKLKNYIALNCLSNITADNLDALHQLFSLEDDLSHSSIPMLQKIDWHLVDAELKWSEQPNAQIICWEDEAYPDQLRQINSPPLILYICGNPACLKTNQIAIVGSRTPTVIGRELASQFAEALSEAGLVVVSGLARGIDGAAHEGALKAGQTVAVMAGGLSSIYPAEHEALAERIMAQGAVISEFPLRQRPQRYSFPRRNRIISGLSLGVLVVEAAVHSGSLITARYAAEQGREVFALPGSIHNPLSKGCHKLLKEGAKLIEVAEDILNELPALKPLQRKNSRRVLKNMDFFLDDQQQKLLSCVGFTVTAVDTVIVRSGFSADVALSLLLSLEMSGCIKSVPGGYCRVS